MPRPKNKVEERNERGGLTQFRQDVGACARLYHFVETCGDKIHDAICPCAENEHGSDDTPTMATIIINKAHIILKTPRGG